MANPEPCPKCGHPMQRRRHGANETAYLQKAYFYREWDYCKRCLQHYEKYKVFPAMTVPAFAKNPWDL